MPKSAFTKVRTSFIGNLTNFNDLLDQLLEDEIISEEDGQVVKKDSVKKEMNRRLFSALDEKQWNKIKDKLISALKETDNESIVEKIMENEKLVNPVPVSPPTYSSTLAENSRLTSTTSPSKKIELNLDFLSENLTNIPAILNELVSKQIIQLKERAVIMSSNVENDQATELFLTLIKKDMDKYLPTVLQILRNNGNGHLAAKIEST